MFNIHVCYYITNQEEKQTVFQKKSEKSGCIVFGQRRGEIFKTQQTGIRRSRPAGLISAVLRNNP